jgi:hypothetical protein
MLNTTDFVYSAVHPEWDNYGGINVKYGKSSAGGPPQEKNCMDHLRSSC